MFLGTFAILFIYFPRLNDIINKYLNPFKSLFIRNFISLPLKNNMIRNPKFDGIRNMYIFKSSKYINYIRDLYIVLDFVFVILSFGIVFYGSFQVINNILSKLGSQSAILETLLDFQHITGNL